MIAVHTISVLLTTGIQNPETRHERGATAVEYAIMVSLIALVIVASVAGLGAATNGLFESFIDEMGW